MAPAATGTSPQRAIAVVVLAVVLVGGLYGAWSVGHDSAVGASQGGPFVGDDVTGPDVANPAQDTTMTIDPVNWDPSASRWSGYGPSYESSPAIASYGATYAHAYGYPTGIMSYDLTVGTIGSGTVSVQARLSSEHSGYSAPADWVSDVTLTLNGQPEGTMEVVADNGVGATYQWTFDASALRVGTNVLSFVVAATAPNQHGLCIYGRSVAAGVDDAAIEVVLP